MYVYSTNNTDAQCMQNTIIMNECIASIKFDWLRDKSVYSDWRTDVRHIPIKSPIQFKLQLAWYL